MQTIDSGSCRTSGAAGQAGAAQGSRGFHGSFQDRADQLVRATVLSDLGQSVGQTAGHGRHSHGIQGVAAAIRQALSGQDVTGTDAADDVLKKIETSLHKAAQKLADRGVDAKTIDATIDRFRAQLANALDGGTSGSGSTGGSGSSSGSGSIGGSSGTTSGSGTNVPAPAPAPAPATTPSVSQFVSREVRKERGAIDLVTAEGDRVSIRFRTKDVVTNSVKQTTASDGTTTTAAKSSVFSRGGVKIEVDGDLNEDEQKAIGDLLGKVDDIATQFFSGDVQAAFSAAGSLGVDSDQIAAYRLNLTYSRKVAAYASAGASLPASTQSPATGSGATAGGATSAGNAGSATGSGSAAGSAGSAAGSGAAGSSASGAGSSSSAPASSAGASDSASAAGSTSASNASGSSASASDSASGNGASATDGTATSGTSDTPPATTPPASAQKTILDFISDALSKLGSANGAGRLSFSTHWKMSVLVTAIQTVQPAQPTTAADQAAASNTQLLGDSLQKIASA